MNRTLRNLFTPSKIGDLLYNELIASMQLYYIQRPFEMIVFKFNSQFCHPRESVSMLIAKLRCLAEFRNFEGTIEVMLRDRLVCVINDE